VHYRYVFTVHCANVNTLWAQCVLHNRNSGYAYARSVHCLRWSLLQPALYIQGTKRNRLLKPTLNRDSSVGTVTRHELNGPGIESRWGARFSAPVQNDPGSPQPHIQWVGLSRGQKSRGVAMTTHPHLAPRLKTKYYPFGASWPVLGWTLPLPLPLPWATFIVWFEVIHLVYTIPSYVYLLPVPTTIFLSDSPTKILHAHTALHNRVTCRDHPSSIILARRRRRVKFMKFHVTRFPAFLYYFLTLRPNLTPQFLF
jgi:hypothetical protein